MHLLHQIHALIKVTCANTMFSIKLFNGAKNGTFEHHTLWSLTFFFFLIYIDYAKSSYWATFAFLNVLLVYTN